MEDNSFLVGDRVVCESIVGWIGEIMRTEGSADGETLFNIVYDEDESSHWISGEHLVLA
jgi:hypothetical protein